GKESDEVYEPGVFYCKDAFEGLAVMDQLVDSDARGALVEKLLAGATEFRAKGDAPVEKVDLTDDSVRSPARTDVPIPAPPFWGAQEVEVDLDEVYRHLDTHVLFKLHWGGKGVKGEAWQQLLRDDFRPRLERMWREQSYLHPRALLGIELAQGRRYSWGYPAVPEQSEHLKVDRLLGLGRIGLSITDGYAPVPEQSTLALVAHHPQAIYFGTRQGRLLPGGSPDD